MRQLIWEHKIHVEMALGCLGWKKWLSSILESCSDKNMHSAVLNKAMLYRKEKKKKRQPEPDKLLKSTNDTESWGTRT